MRRIYAYFCIYLQICTYLENKTCNLLQFLHYSYPNFISFYYLSSFLIVSSILNHHPIVQYPFHRNVLLFLNKVKIMSFVVIFFSFLKLFNLALPIDHFSTFLKTPDSLLILYYYYRFITVSYTHLTLPTILLV